MSERLTGRGTYHCLSMAIIGTAILMIAAGFPAHGDPLPAWMFNTFLETSVNGPTVVNNTLNNGLLFQRPSLVFDAAGNPRVAYGDYSKGGLYFASSANGGANWTSYLVTTAVKKPFYTSLALTAQGDPCIAYIEYDQTKWGGTPGKLYIASSGDGGITWLNTLIATKAHSSVSLKIDKSKSNQPHLIYAESMHGGCVVYATRVNGAWVKHTVDSATAPGSIGMGASIAMDSAGRLHASYWRQQSENSSNQLVYALSVDGGKTWRKMVIDQLPSLQFGGATTIAVDRYLGIHIGYGASAATAAGGSASFQVKYAYFPLGQTTPPVWTVEKVDGPVGGWPNEVGFAVIGDEPVFIYLQGQYPGFVRLAYWSGQGWVKNDIIKNSPFTYSGKLTPKDLAMAANPASSAMGLVFTDSVNNSVKPPVLTYYSIHYDFTTLLDWILKNVP